MTSKQAVQEPPYEQDAPDRSPIAKAPPLKRPEGMTDLHWDWLRLSKSPEMVGAMADAIDNGNYPSAEDAADMLDIAKAAEMSTLRELRRLQRTYAPKLAELAARYNAHMSASAHLFKRATEA